MMQAAHGPENREELPRVQVVEREQTVTLKTDMKRGHRAPGYAYVQLFAYGDAIGVQGVGAFLEKGDLVVMFDKTHPNPVQSPKVH
jgi:hypothetical protein